MLVALAMEVFEGWREVEESGDRAGSSLPRFRGLNWQVRLAEVIAFARREGHAETVKGAQAMMGRMAKAEEELAHAARYPAEAGYNDSLHWLMATGL
jgi:hypothetical protein